MASVGPRPRPFHATAGTAEQTVPASVQSGSSNSMWQRGENYFEGNSNGFLGPHAVAHARQRVAEPAKNASLERLQGRGLVARLSGMYGPESTESRARSENHPPRHMQVPDRSGSAQNPSDDEVSFDASVTPRTVSSVPSSRSSSAWGMCDGAAPHSAGGSATRVRHHVSDSCRPRCVWISSKAPQDRSFSDPNGNGDSHYLAAAVIENLHDDSNSAGSSKPSLNSSNSESRNSSEQGTPATSVCLDDHTKSSPPGQDPLAQDGLQQCDDAEVASFDPGSQEPSEDEDASGSQPHAEYASGSQKHDEVDPPEANPEPPLAGHASRLPQDGVAPENKPGAQMQQTIEHLQSMVLSYQQKYVQVKQNAQTLKRALSRQV